MSGSRSCGRLLCEEEVWLVITAIVSIARPCMAYCIEMIMKCLNVIYVDPLPFQVLKLHSVHKGEFFKERFHVLK